ncbi:hypothetical protein PMIN02_010828 [Paraphaeosphaeria minitans]
MVFRRDAANPKEPTLKEHRARRVHPFPLSSPATLQRPTCSPAIAIAAAMSTREAGFGSSIGRGQHLVSIVAVVHSCHHTVASSERNRRAASSQCNAMTGTI